MRQIIRGVLALASVLALVSITGMAHAQGSEELLSFSRQNFGMSSARSAAMGGAFTSLGADPAAMSINPAGMGMYKSGEISLSPGVRVAGRLTDYSGNGGSISNRMNDTRANIGSFSIVYAGDNFAVGFGMNRLADYSGKSHAVGYGERSSIGDMFVEQLYGLPSSTIGAPEKEIYQAFFRYPSAYWGGIMGYQAGLFDPVPGSNPQSYTTTTMIQKGILLYPDRYRVTTGAINEYTISGGYNLDDIFYVGGTLGIQDIYFNRFDTYTEFTSKGNYGLNDLIYNQNLRMGGAGVNLKVGATVRPVPWLRIGVAYHSPTWINMSEEYDADMTVNYTQKIGGYLYGYSDTPIHRQEYNMRTPSRLLTGVSVTLGNVGILSVDYERTWYQNMKYTSDGYKDINETIQALYAPTNIFRAGLEFQPVRSLFLRAGYGYSSSVYQNADYKAFGEYQQFSGGIGFRSRVVNVDLAYVYGKTAQMPSKPYYYKASDSQEVTTDGTIYTQDRNSNIILTLAFKF